MKFAALLLLVTASVLPAQTRGGRPCRLELEGTTNATSVVSTKSPTNKVILHYSGGIKAWCRGTTMKLTGDSAEVIEDSRYLTIIGHARYWDDTTKAEAATITANSLQYFDADAHMVALGDAVLTGKKSTLTAQQVIYYRASPGIRTGSSALALGKPRVELRDSTGARDTATTFIEADRLRMERDSLFYAAGTVTVTRPDLIASGADSAETNTSKQFVRLLGGAPHLEGRGARPFTLDGLVLDIFGREHKIERLLAKGKAAAVSDSMKLTADTLNIQMSSSRINRVIASGPGRARATSPDRDIIANYIDLNMPDGKLRDLLAVGRARAETRPDTAIITTERDWIEGDTITAAFDTVATGDTSSQPALRLLIARNNARTYYQMAPKTGTDTLPSLNYVLGKQIEVFFKQRGVDNVRVTGAIRGLNLEPLAPDTTRAKPPVPPRIPPPRSQ